MCDVFSNKRIEKSYDVFFWAWFLKLRNKTNEWITIRIQGHLEISALASRRQHRHWRRHRHCKNFLLFEALIFAFGSFLLSKTSMVKFFSNTLASFPGSVYCCLDQLFCRDVISTCFWRKKLRHGRYLRSFKNTQVRNF